MPKEKRLENAASTFAFYDAALHERFKRTLGCGIESKPEYVGGRLRQVRPRCAGGAVRAGSRLVEVIEAYVLELAGAEAVDIVLRALPTRGHSRTCASSPRFSPQSTWPNQSPPRSGSLPVGG